MKQQRKVTTPSPNREGVVGNSVHEMIDDLQNFAWFVGLCEGEAAFQYNLAKKSPRISIQMTDEGPIARAAALFGLSYWKLAPARHYKATYRLDIQGVRALRLMRRMMPFLCARRQAAVREVERRYLADHPTATIPAEPLPLLATSTYSIVLPK